MTLCCRDRSTSRRSWSSPPFGTRRRSRLGYRFGHRCRFSRRPSGSTETKLQCQRGSALRIAGWGHWMFTRQVPASAILFHRQSMAGREMPSKHLRLRPACRPGCAYSSEAGYRNRATRGRRFKIREQEEKPRKSDADQGARTTRCNREGSERAIR
jgi:hypothetical protein